MEGCPRSSMLSIDLKDSIPAEFTDSIKKYITDHYQEDPENYKHECQQIEQLRSACLHPGHDHSGCSTLRRYFSQLQYLQSRFPMVDGGAVSVQFTWTDLYSEESIALADVRFEQAAILHNLGALHSQLGAQEDRTGEEGMKVACTHFQAAAGIFQYLKNTVMVPLASMKLPWVSEDHFAVPFFDLASCVLQLYINILLGQAQECLLEKSILDGRKDSLIARISMQVYDYYQQALGILESLGSSYLGSKKSKMWTKAVKIKACHFTCVSYIHMSNHAHENQKFGEKVAYLKAAHQKLTEAQKQSKGQPERTLELLQFMADVVNNKLEGAVKDNDFIFHEVVPDLAALPVIKGASLVKPIPFQPCDPSVAGPDIFQRLIPMEAHTDASIYSEEKAKLLRRYNASIDVKNKQLAQSLASLHIDDLLQPVETDTLPTLLKEKHDTLSKDVVLLSQTEENIEESSKLSDDVENTLKSISSMLDEDEKKEKLAQGGKQETTQEREDIRKEYDKCQEALSKANHTNNELARVYKAHRQNLELIAGSEEQLLAALPSLNIIDSPVDDGAVQRLRDLIAKVEEMKVQRKSLEEDLRNKLNEDDITGLLVTRDGNKMAFFDQQLKKHDTACSLIQANLDAQDKILSALTEANAKYAKTRQAVKESTQRREEVVQALILSYNTFCELQGKLSRGVDFYKRLSSTVRKLEEKCKNFFDNHSKELDKLIEKKKVATEPPKPPSRPSAAKPDHLVRPQQPHPPPSSIAILPGQPPNLIGPSSIANMPPGVHPQHYVPRQPIPPSLPRHPTPPSSLPYSVPQTHIPADQAIHTLPRMSYPFPDSQRQMQVSEPGQFPRHSVPGQVSPAQGLPRLPFQNQVLPNQQPTGINTSLSQVRLERPSHVASFQQPDILGGQQQFPGQSMTRPQVPQSVRPPQPDLISQVRPQFPGQFVPGQRMPFHRPESPQSPMGQLPTPPRPQAQSTSPVPLQPRLSSPMSHPRHPPATHPQHFQPGSLTPSSVHQQINPVQPGQLHLRPEQPSQPGLSPQFQPRQPFNQQFRPGQPLQPGQIHRHPFHQGLQTQVRPSSPSQQQFRPELLSQQQFRPQQASQQFPPHQSQQQFRPQSPQQSLRPQILQTQYRPEQLSQQPQQFRPQLIRPDLPTKQQQQQFQSQNISQQQFRPQSAQPSLRPQQQQHNQQFRPEQTPSQQFQPQQPIIPQRPSQPQFGSQQTSQLQQPLQQQFRSQLPQGHPQSFQVSQQSQLPPSSFPQPIQTVRQGPNLPQPLLPEQSSNKQEQTPLQPFRPGLSSQQPFRPDQSSQQPVRPELSSQQPFRPDQSSQQTFRPNQSSQQPFRPNQSSQQPFRPNQSSQQPFRPELSSQQPFRPDQSSQHSVQPELTSQQPFRANQSSQQPVRPDLPSQQPFRPQRLSQQPFRPDQSSQEPVRPELSSQQPFRPDQTSQQSTRPDQSSQRPFPLDKQQPSSQQGPSHSLTQDQQQLPSTFRPESSFQNLPQNPLFQQGSEQRTFQVDQQPDANLNNQASRPLVEPTHRIDAEPQHQTFSNPNVSQSFSRQTSSAIAHSYPETGAFIANPSSLPSSYGSWQAPSLINQGSRPFPSSVTSSDYLTSFSVALAQNQLSQYQNSSSQQQMQQFQQQLMLQQQQLILQQQEMLKQQQSQQHTHDSDQVQIGLLLQQILQQQKQLTDLEMKIKEKSENQVKHDNIESSATNNTDDEKKLTPPEQQIVKKKESSLIQVEKVESTKSDSKPSLSALTPSEDHKSAGVVKTDNKNSSGAFLPDYASVGKWFSDLSITPIVGKTNADAKGSDEKTTKDCESEHGSNKNDHVESVVEHEEDHKHEPFKEENDNTQKLETIELKPESEEFELEEFEPEPVKSDLTSEDDDDDIYLKNDEIPHVEDDKETPKIEKDPHEDEEMEEDRRRTMEEQIKQIKELQNKPPVHVTSTFYEPGQVPTSRRNEPVSCPTDEEDTKPSLLRQCGHYYASQISSIDQTTNNSCLNSDEELQALVSAVKGFDLVVKSLSADKHGSGLDGFSIEWRELERLQEYDSASKTANAGTMNQPKNRYKDILPWDHTRVKLTFKDESDYINANFVKNITPLSPSFIATQGPIATTLTDFWLMIWEQQSNIVIMLTREVEGNKLMCHQYWPIDEGHTVLFGPIRVLLKTVITSPLSVKRVMHVQHTDSDDTLIVTHLQFCGWPDKGVPETSVDLLSFVNVARSCYQQSLKESEEKPIIVHCSAGIGRTGTFIVLYSAIQEFNANREFVNIPRLVRNLRLHRKYMVQKQEQYEFCYKTLLFYARQFLDLELASLTPQRRASLNLGQLEPHPVGKNAPTAEDNRPRKGSNDARFIGELKADDSLETNDEEDNKTEQSISEKYCKGTLETDAEGTRKKKKSTDRSESTESTAQQSTTDTGKVSIGKDEEVRFIKDEENDLETEELETQIDEQKSEEEQSSLESTALEDNNSDAKANTSAVQAVDRDEMTFGTDTGTKNNDSATIEEQDSCKDDVHSELKTESETEESLQTKNEET